MKIALDGLAIGNRGGTGRYTEMLASGLLEILGEAGHLFMLLHEDAPIPGHWKQHPRLTIARIPKSGSAWLPGFIQVWHRHRYLNSWLKELAAAEGVDIFHGPSFVLPSIPPGVASAVTVHDLAFRLYPETLPWMRRVYLERTVPDAVRRANIVLADCDAVRDRIRSELGAIQLVETVLLAVDAPRRMNPSVLEGLRAKFLLGTRYWLTISTLEPRKNLVRLLEAYRLALGAANLPQLVIGGRRGWGCGALDRILRDRVLRNRVIRTGYLSENERDALLEGAEMFLSPSIYEGCDLPTLEAAARGIPLLASDIGAHRQYLPDSTRFINAYDISAWTNCLIESGSKPPKTVAPVNIRSPRDMARDVYATYEAALRGLKP